MDDEDNETEKKRKTIKRASHKEYPSKDERRNNQTGKL